MERTCSSLDMSRNGVVLDFYRSRMNLSYAETEKDHFVAKSLNVYSVPYACSLLLLNIGTLLGRRELKIRK
jgi:hypothetical protein